MKAPLLFLFAVALSASASRAQTVVDVIVASENHTTLETAVIAAGLADDLATDGPFTVFAPDDDAFDALEAAEPGIIAELLADTARLAAILRYHVLGAEVTAADIAAGQSYASTLRNQLSVQLVKDDDGVTLNNSAMVNAADIDATNGVVHSIDAVIFALSVIDAVRASPAHSTLEVALDTGGYGGVLGRDDLSPNTFTLWAPDNEAFDALPDGTLDDLLTDRDNLGTLQSILQYHVLLLNTGGAPFSTELIGSQLFFFSTLNLSGQDFGFVQQIRGNGNGSVAVNDVVPDILDIRCTNGVVYSISEVLSAPSTADFVAISDVHTTLATALDATGLDETLDDESSAFTLFAPTNSAFAETFTPEEIAALVAAPDDLRPTLLYHALAGRVPSDSIPAGLSFSTTVAGESLQLIGEINDDGDIIGATVDNIELVSLNRKTTNGIVHVISAGVLTRPDVVDIAVRSPVHGTLVSLLTQAELVATLENPEANLTVFAPTDEAFAGVPQTALDSIVNLGFLSDVLTYHVLPNTVTSEDIVGQGITSATTVEGSDVSIAVTNGQVVLNGNVTVTVADVIGTNGIVHVVDGVLLPEGLFTGVTATAAEAGITVGPIPAADHTVVTLPASFTDGARLDLFDVRGQRLRSQALSSGRERVELSDLSAGTYFMVFEADGRRYLKPLVVQ